jgi:sn-glycerol 3-phosphate transport system ATP-binding protein
VVDVSLEGVRKSFPNGFAALHGIDLAVADGEFIVIVGSSGCGKSTLLRLVAGLETVSQGRILIGGRDVTRLEPSQRDIAMVFQNYALYPHMTVFDNMAYGLRNRGVGRTEIARRVAEAAAILDIEAVLDRKPRQLSGGQRQRVAMGRAIVREPKVFLFDEPLSNLDAKLRVQMRGEIRSLQRRLGVTSIYVTHDQAEAMTMADRLVVMRAGRIEQIGAPLEVYGRPRTGFVAAFIGSPAMNLLPAVLEADGIRVDGGFRLPAVGAMPAAEVGRPILLGVRPEHVETRPCDPLAALVVDLVEPLGAETLVHGLVGQHRMTVRVSGQWSIGPGEALPISLRAQDLHLFGADSTERLNWHPGP